MRILQAQMTVAKDTAEAAALLNTVFEKAAAESADMIALPEMFCCPYKPRNFPVYAQPEGGGIWSLCSQLAKTYGIWLSAGSVPERDGENVYNTAYVFDRKGCQAAKHRKMHLFDIAIKGGQHFRESDTLTAGREVTTFDTEFGKVGLCICYDIRFPELTRLMALDGARVILCPAAFNMTTGPLHWELLFRSQAMYNQVFAVGTAPARDMTAKYHSYGHSIAVDPWGNVLAEMDEKEGFQLVDLDLSVPGQVREELPLLKHRRTDLYRLSRL